MHSFDTRSLQDCLFFLQGRCTKGAMCPFRHDTSKATEHKKVQSQVPCIYFSQGMCAKGALCPFLHDPATTQAATAAAGSAAAPAIVPPPAAAPVVPPQPTASIKKQEEFLQKIDPKPKASMASAATGPKQAAATEPVGAARSAPVARAEPKPKAAAASNAKLPSRLAGRLGPVAAAAAAAKEQQQQQAIVPPKLEGRLGSKGVSGDCSVASPKSTEVRGRGAGAAALQGVLPGDGATRKRQRQEESVSGNGVQLGQQQVKAKVGSNVPTSAEPLQKKRSIEGGKDAAKGVLKTAQGPDPPTKGSGAQPAKKGKDPEPVVFAAPKSIAEIRKEKQQKRAGGASEPKDQAPAGGRIKKTQPASPQPVVPKAKQQPKAQNAPIAKTTPSSKKTQSTPVAAVKAALAPQSETKVGEVGPDPALDDVDIEFDIGDVTGDLGGNDDDDDDDFEAQMRALENAL